MTPIPRRSFRLRMSVRALLVFVLFIGLVIGLLARRVGQARRQRIAVAEIRGCGGELEYDWQQWTKVDESGQLTRPALPAPPGPAWLRTLIGDDFFQSVTVAEIHPSKRDCSNREIAVRMVRSFPQLRFLRLECSESCDSTLEVIGELKELETLIVFGHDITDSGIAHLTRLTNLKQLQFLDCGPISDDTLRHLSRLPKLEILAICGDRFSDQGLAVLPNFPSLEQLHLRTSSPRITDAGLIQLQGSRQMQYLTLELDGTNITAQGIRHLQRVKGLRGLTIKGGPVSRTDLERLERKIPNLRTTLE
jgi:hypothetical protein